MADLINLLSSQGAAPPKAESKTTVMTKLLMRTHGATLDEMMAATTWQSHSIRAFLSGIRKKGNVLIKEQRKSGQLAYRMPKSAEAA